MLTLAKQGISCSAIANEQFLRNLPINLMDYNFSIQTLFDENQLKARFTFRYILGLIY